MTEVRLITAHKRSLFYREGFYSDERGEKEEKKGLNKNVKKRKYKRDGNKMVEERHT